MLSRLTTAQLAIESWLLLLYFDTVMQLRGFPKLYDRVRRCGVKRETSSALDAARLSFFVDAACVLYFKQVLCLQRSAALAVLMRRHGLEAELVIGAQLFPFLSHAWVEANGCVTNDKPENIRFFHVLERC